MPRYSFPAKGPAPDAMAGTVDPKSDPFASHLEAGYPRILEAIISMWGHQEMNTYFQRLSIDDRGGRQGFPPEVWAEVRTLQDIHLLIVPAKNVGISVI